MTNDIATLIAIHTDGTAAALIRSERVGGATVSTLTHPDARAERRVHDRNAELDSMFSEMMTKYLDAG